MNLYVVVAGDYETVRNVGAFTDADEATAFAALVKDRKTLETNPDLYDANVEIQTFLANDPLTERTVDRAYYSRKLAANGRGYAEDGEYEVSSRQMITSRMPSPAVFERRADGSIFAFTEALSEAEAAEALGNLLVANNVQV